MGCADFYLNIISDKKTITNIKENLCLYEKYDVFNYVCEDERIEVEGFFDNLLISAKILFNSIASVAHNTSIVIESQKNEIRFLFNSDLELFNWLYGLYKDKIESYFCDYGCLIVPVDNYYKKRIKLKKYYKKLK